MSTKQHKNKLESILASQVLAYPLTTAQTTRDALGDKPGLETKASEVLLDLAADERTEQTKALGLAGIQLDDFL